MQNLSFIIPSLEEQFKEVVNKYDKKFKLISVKTSNYLKVGFEGVLKIKIPLRLTQQEFILKNSKGKIINDFLYIQGYLNEIDIILEMIN